MDRGTGKRTHRVSTQSALKADNDEIGRKIFLDLLIDSVVPIERHRGTVTNKAGARAGLCLCAEIRYIEGRCADPFS